jgi:hypothetical protein
MAAISYFKERFLLMSISDANTNSNQASGHSPHLSDLFHIRQLERQLKHALEELEQVKTRVSRLEQEVAVQSPAGVFTEKTQIPQQAGNAAAMPPLPIAEIRQLAEMAKRFR